MTNQEDLKLLFTGTEINCNVLKDILSDNNIPALIKNDMSSSKMAGFGVSLGLEAHIYVIEKNFEQAQKLLEEFKSSIE
ncbi:MAG: DUF2007 domain-containing protein [Bacteroidales bacterium]|nr:DUF2007 domain-containing protein [Bacteroidales bacterium]